MECGRPQDRRQGQRDAQEAVAKDEATMSACTQCKGSRIVFGTTPGSIHHHIACPRCNGTGREGERRTPYYVIFINRQRRCIELHLPSCNHGIQKKVETGEFIAIGGDNVDPKEMVLTLPSEYREMALLIEECLV